MDNILAGLKRLGGARLDIVDRVEEWFIAGHRKNSRRRIDELRAYSNLVDEYLKELPCLVHGRDKVIRDYTYTEEHEECDKQAREEGHLPIFTVSPKMFRKRPPEEMEELRRAQERERAERYRSVYTSLGLRVISAQRWYLGVDLEGRKGR